MQINDVFGARLVAERSVSRFQGKEMAVERVDGAAKGRIKVMDNVECTAARETINHSASASVAHLLIRNRTTSGAVFFFSSKKASLLAVKTYFRFPVRSLIWVLSAVTRTWDMNQVSSFTRGLAAFAFSAAVFHFSLGILGVEAGDDVEDDISRVRERSKCWFRSNERREMLC